MADDYKCKCGSEMPSPQYRRFGWECGRCGRTYGIDGLGMWFESRGPTQETDQ